MIPAFRIVAAGQDATASIADRLISLSITDEDGDKADRLEIGIDDRGGLVAIPDMEAELQVALGFRGMGLSDMGRFKVDKVSGSYQPRDPCSWRRQPR